MNKHTIIKKKSTFDKFYTKESIAENLIDVVLEKVKFDPNNYLFVEPAAGSGAFIKPLLQKKHNVIGYDIDPALKGIKKADFLTLELVKKENQNIIVIGNPPFGRVSSLAIKFFNKSAEFSDFICFIVPKTFRKQSVQDKLNKNFWLVYDQELPQNSFTLNKKPYDVPCCFQIWERRAATRLTEDLIQIDFFDYTKDPKEADLAIRRVGGNAGRVIEKKISQLSKQSHYFIVLKEISKKNFLKKYKKIKFTEVVNNTAGIRSLSKKELAKLIKNHF